MHSRDPAIGRLTLMIQSPLKPQQKRYSIPQYCPGFEAFCYCRTRFAFQYDICATTIMAPPNNHPHRLIKGDHYGHCITLIFRKSFFLYFVFAKF